MIPTYVIACDELPERRAACRAHLAERGVEHTIWRGVHGKTWGLATTREYEPGKRISPGHVALNLNHWTLWNHLQDKPGWPSIYEGQETFIICEDDVEFPADWEAQLAGVRAELDAHMPDWQFVFLGLCESVPQVWHKVTERVGPADSRLCRLNDPFGTHCYMVRESALPVLIDRMRAAERNMDQQLFANVLRDNRVRWCAVLPTIVRQRTFDYGSTGKPEWAPSCVDAEDAPPALTFPTNHMSAAETRTFSRSDAEPPPDLITASLPMVDPFPCIYRGDPADVYARDARGRSVPVSLCANREAYCHSRTESRSGHVIDEYGATVLACESCGLRNVMAADAPRPRLPVPDGHFNPSMAVYRGRLILATRDSWGHSRVALWELANARPDWTGDWRATPIGSYASAHPAAPRLEDPRLFVAPDPKTGDPALHAMFNLPDGYPPRKVQVGYAQFAEDLSGITHTEVFVSPKGNAYEKNWVPFPEGEELRWVYATSPRHVVVGGPQTWDTPNPLRWGAGVIRGGAAPVRSGDEYYHFFHGCLKRVQGSVYTVGCAVFEAKPPYRVLRQTSAPLAWPDLPAVGENVTKRFVLWPGGAVPHAGAWHLACGIDDSYSRIIRLPFADVEKALHDVPAAPTSPGLRDTPLARGVHESERKK